MALQVWLPLTGNLENQGLSDLTFSITHTNTSVDNNGKIGKCYANTTNNYGGIISDKAIDLGTTVSMACWFKYTSLEATAGLGGGLVSQHCYNDNTGLGITIKYVSATTGYISCSTGTGSSRTFNTYYGTTLLQANTWYHATLTYDGTTIKLYLNGVLEKSVNYAQKNKSNHIGVFAWSINNGVIHNDYKLIGSINDVRIYDHALSPKEIKLLSQGLVCHYTLGDRGCDNLVPNQSQYNVSTPYILTTTSNDGYKWLPNSSFEVEPSTTYTFSVYCDGEIATAHAGAQGTFSMWLYLCNDGNASKSASGGYDSPICFLVNNYNHIQQGQRHIWQYTTTSTQKYMSIRMNNYGTGGVTHKYWGFKVEKGSKATPWLPNSADPEYTAMGYNDTTVYDSSGYNYHGTTWAYDSNGSIEISSSTPRYSVSTFINSADNTTSTASGTRYIYGNCSLKAPNKLTVAFWDYPMGGYNDTTAQGQLSLTNYPIGNNAGADYQGGPLNHRDTGFDVNSADGTIHKRLSIIFTRNEWHHYAVTYDGRYARMYKDGAETSNVDMGSNVALGDMCGIVLGFSKAGGVWRSNKSKYSDFRLYATALSADDIKELYHTSASIDKNGNLYAYELKEG